MATLTVQVNVGSDAVPSWATLNADEATIVKRHGRGGHARFRIPNASVANRVSLRLGRTVRLKYVRGADTLWFKGICTDPRVVSVASGKFNLEVDVAEMAEAAKYRNIINEAEYPDSQAATQTDIPCQRDATVDEGNPTTNNGTANNLEVGFTSTLANELRAYMQFDISGISSADGIMAALLRISVISHDEGSGKLTLHASDGAWAESTITWNNKPAIDDTADADTGQENRIGEKSVDETMAGKHTILLNVTDYYRAVHAGTITDNGFAIKMAEFTSPSGGFPAKIVELVSREATSDTSKIPRLWVTHQLTVLVSDVVSDLFTNNWSAVDITGIEATAEFVQLQVIGGGGTELESITDVRVEGLKFDRFDNLFDAMELLTNQVPGWEWWLDTTDGDDIVLRFERSEDTAAASIGESDILPSFELQADNQRVINHVIVFGPTDDQDVIRHAVVGEARSASSQAIFGYRYKWFHEPALASRELLNDRAREILHETQSEYWTVAVEVPEHRSLRPGRQVTLDLSSYGLDDSNFFQDYIVQETRDSFERGQWTRNMVLREFIT